MAVSTVIPILALDLVIPTALTTILHPSPRITTTTTTHTHTHLLDSHSSSSSHLFLPLFIMITTTIAPRRGGASEGGGGGCILHGTAVGEGDGSSHGHDLGGLSRGLDGSEVRRGGRGEE